MIKEFEHAFKEYGIPAYILENIEAEFLRNSDDQSPHLTALQEKALKSKEFWGEKNDIKNLIIQGATSSGKTLLAELLAMQAITQSQNVIYLVPLKALVSEKVQKFKEHFKENATFNIKIYGSSSDYQDHDEELSDGDYNIAVIVYEKFFAMLAEQKNNRLMSDCGLIVIDEIQMISREDRGPKLEYAVTKVLNNYGSNVRLVGLTTIDCDVKKLVDWLGAAEINDPTRPIGLIERVISVDTGNYWERTIKTGEDIHQPHQETSIEPIKGNIKFDIVGRKRKENKVSLLSALLRQIYEKNENTKVIVFCNSRIACRNLAQDIANSKLFELQKISDDFLTELEQADDEQERNILQEKLLPFGVAYHSASLPTSLRDLVESEFRNPYGSIRILMATETITIGVNLPADIMILFDYKVRRGEAQEEDLRPQEYKNYIGRAGRLGITKTIGQSYLFVNLESDIKKYWKKYVQCDVESIQSSMIDKDIICYAPYYLNLLCQRIDDNFNKETIERISKKTLTYSDKKDYIKSDTLIEHLQKKNLIQKSDDDDEEDEVSYSLTEFGNVLASYALSLKTVRAIYRSFVVDSWISKKEDDQKENIHGGLPYEYTSNDLKNDKYLLDILYTICKMDEVKRHPHPMIPEITSNPELYHAIKNAVTTYIKNIDEEKFWNHSDLRKRFTDDVEPQPTELKAAYRAILLLHWTKGDKKKEIQEKFSIRNTQNRFAISDLARMAETCSYIIEAVGKALEINPRRIKDDKVGSLQYAFYGLSLRIKYGMSDDNLIQIASRHIYGVTRNTILNLGKYAEENKFDTALQFIFSGSPEVDKFLTQKQTNELINQLNDRYSDGRIERIIEKSYKAFLIEHDMKDVFDSLARVNLDDQSEWEKNLFTFFESLGIKMGTVKKSGELDVSYIKLREDDFKNEFLYFIGDEEQLKALSISENSSNILILKNKYSIPDNIQKKVSFIESKIMVRFYLRILQFNGKVNNLGIVLLHLLSHNKGYIAYPGDAKATEKIEKYLRRYHNSSLDSNNNPFDKYCQKFNYELVEHIDNMKLHIVQNTKVNDSQYYVKEIRIPSEDSDSQNSTSEIKRASQEIYNMLKKTEYNDDTLKTFLSENFPEVRDYLDLIIEQINIRKNNLNTEALKDKWRYLSQIIIVACRAYRCLNEVRVVAKAPQKLGILKPINPEILWDNNEELEDGTHYIEQNNALGAYVFFSSEKMENNISSPVEDPRKIIDIGKQICDALSWCHKYEIYHKDIKPENILKDLAGNYYLSDFGASDYGCSINDGITGTKGYLAPELIEAAEKHEKIPYSPLSDIYAFGKTLESIIAQTFKRYKTTETSMMLDRLKDLGFKAISKEPNKRYKTADDFKAALENIKLEQ